MDFMIFKKAIQTQFDTMSKLDLFATDVEKDQMWDMYIDSFPEGTNLIYKERTEYDCQCCKAFIRTCGNMVAIIDYKLVSIWDIQVGGTFQIVADAMSVFVKSAFIRDKFVHYQKDLGTDSNLQLLEGGETQRWQHFYLELPGRLVMEKFNIGPFLSDLRGRKDSFQKSLEEISLEAAETVLELIEQNSIYRGSEFKYAVEDFIRYKQQFVAFSGTSDHFFWVHSTSAPRIRNTMIGTLLTDISEGVPLDDAVRMYESKAAPENYKRPTALITKGMIDKAQKKVEELGIQDSLKRRFAVLDDITINNVVFANRAVKTSMDVWDELSSSTPENLKKFEKVDDVDIKTFIDTIIPKAESIELMLERRHINNFVSLISPQDLSAKGIFKWDNNFSWAYNGEVADSMKERVKKAGGNVAGVLRFSIQWNDERDCNDDLDAHCYEPDGNQIYFSRKSGHRSTGKLDVDIQQPEHVEGPSVENITWSDINKMQEGSYQLLVHNYAKHGGKSGFTAEIEYDGQIYSYSYPKALKQNEKVVVADIHFSRKDGIRFITSLDSHSVASKEVWGVKTQQFQNVSMIMNSPNHWDGNETGNKHFFFMLDGCKNENQARGFFNEFLDEDLRVHRKVFEVLGSKMKVEKSDNQLSGLGFSSTQKNSVLCKVSGSFSRVIKIIF